MDDTTTKKRPAGDAPAGDATAASTSKRPRHAAEEEEEEEDDMAFLARLQQQAEQEEAEISKAARLRSTMSHLRQQEQQQDEDSEEDDDDEQQQNMPRHTHTTPFPRPQTDDDDLSSGLERALELNDFETSHAIIEYDPELMLARINEELEQPLAVAINARFARGIKFLLHKNCPLLEVNGQGWSALHLAVEAFEEMPFLLRYILQYRGLDINARAPLDKVSPLSLASDERALKLLLASGADPSQPVSAAAAGGGSGKVEEEEETLLQRIERTWPKGKKKKKARFMLTTLAPYQSYMLSKLCLLAEVYRGKAPPPPSSTTTTTDNKPQQTGGAAASASASASVSLSSSSSSTLDALTQTARRMLIDTRLETHTQLINIWKADQEEEGDQGGEGEIMCKEEVPGKGIFSFVQDGKVFIARSRSTSPNYTYTIPPFHKGVGGGGGGGGGGGASSSSSATSSPLTAPLEEKGDYTQTYTQTQQGNPNPHPHPAPPSSPTLCPLSVLKEANIDIFLVGDAEGEGKGEGDNEKEGGGGKEGGREEGEGRSSKGCGEEEWEIVPPLPRVEIHYTQTQADDDGATASRDPLTLAAAVLHHLVEERRNDSVLDALHGFLWMGGGGNGNRRAS